MKLLIEIIALSIVMLLIMASVIVFGEIQISKEWYELYEKKGRDDD